jgi:hypothetical protein
MSTFLQAKHLACMFLQAAQLLPMFLQATKLLTMFLQGCRAISPVWMSYYVDGCSQDLHCDSFHGPFAYVLSLTPWEGRVFTGALHMLRQCASCCCSCCRSLCSSCGASFHRK